jgi:hypothetical protein
MVNTAMKWAVVVKNLVGRVICEQEMLLAGVMGVMRVLQQLRSMLSGLSSTPLQLS